MTLDEKKDDVKAKAYSKQIKLILKAEGLVKQSKIDEAIQTFDQSIKMKEGSKVIASKSKDKKESLLLFQENEKNIILSQSGYFTASNGKIDELLKVDLSQFASIQDEAKKLKDSNNEAIKNAEIAKVKEEADKQIDTAKAAFPFERAPGIKEQFEKSAAEENGYIDLRNNIICKKASVNDFLHHRNAVR